jgi:hypothetical protein
MRNESQSITADLRKLAAKKSISETEALRQSIHTLHIHLQSQIDQQAQKPKEYNWNNDFG